MPNLDQVIMVLDPLVIFTEQVLQIISFPLLRIKSLILYLPAHPPPLDQVWYILLGHRQACQEPEMFFLFHIYLVQPSFYGLF